MVWQIFPWVEPSNNQDSQHNRDEFEADEVMLVIGEFAVNTFRRLSETETGTDGHKEGSDPECENEVALSVEGASEVSILDQGDGEEDEKDKEREESSCLECQSTEEDSVSFISLLVVAVRLSNTNQSCPQDLENCCNHIGSDEHPKDKLRSEDLVSSPALSPRPANKARETDVDGSGDEDRRGDDEEVLHDEVDDIVWVLLCRESAEGVAHYFHQTGEGEGDEVPGLGARDHEGVPDECDEEEDYGCNAEGEGREVSVRGMLVRCLEKRLRGGCGMGWVLGEAEGV